jgi:hypothetical protein
METPFDSQRMVLRFSISEPYGEKNGSNRTSDLLVHLPSGDHSCFEKNRVNGIENQDEVFIETEVGVLIHRHNAYATIFIFVPLIGIIGSFFGFLAWEVRVCIPGPIPKRIDESQVVKLDGERKTSV